MNSITEYCLTIGLFFLISCGNESSEIVIPSDMIPEEQFMEVLADVTLIEAVRNLNTSKEMDQAGDFHSYYEDIWARHKISEEKFEKSFEFYKSEPELMAKVYRGSATILKLLEDDINEKKKQKSNKPTKRDSSANKKENKLPVIPQQR